LIEQHGHHAEDDIFAVKVIYHSTAFFPLPSRPEPRNWCRFANEILKGTVSVNPNWTGTATVMFFESGALERTSVLSLVFDVLSTHVRMVQKSLTLPDGTKLPVVVTVEGEKLGGD
jgi:hypothetical protein